MNVDGGKLFFQALLNNENFNKGLGDLEKKVNTFSLETEEKTKKVSKSMAILFSDSAKEVDAYRKSLTDVGGKTISAKDSFLAEINKDLQSGKITAEQFKKELEYFNSPKKQFSVGPSAKEINNKIGLIEKLSLEFEQLEAAQLKTADVNQLGIYNAKLEDTSNKIKKLQNAGRIGFDDFGNKLSVSLDKPIGKMDRLIYAQKLYKDAASNSVNPDIISKYNRKLQETEVQINQTKNVGKKGFDEMGNAIKGSTNYLGRAFSGLKLIANILPGVGIAGLLAFAAGPIVDYILKLDIFGKKITQALTNYKTFGEVMVNANKLAGSEISTLNILYKSAIDVSLAQKDRIAAGEELKKQYPASFANSTTQSILNGEEKKSFDELTNSILANSKAKAAKDKLDQLASDRLNIEFQKQKIRNANNAENKRAKDITVFNEFSGDSQTTSSQSVKDINNNRAKEALAEQDAKLKIITAEETFLVKFAGQSELLNSVIKRNGKETAKEINKATSDLAAAQQRQRDLLLKLSDLDSENSGKTFTKDDQEFEALKEKFTKVRQLVQDFNSDTKNKGVAKIDIAMVDKVEDKSTKQLIAKQQAEKDLIEATLREKNFIEALKATETFEEQKQAIVAKYAKIKDDLLTNKDQLEAGVYAEKVALANEQSKEEIDKVNETQFQKIAAVKAFYDGVEDLSDQSARTVIANVKTELKNSKLTADARLKILKDLEDASDAVNNKLPKKLISLAQELGSVANAIKPIDEGFADVLGTAANIIGSVGEIKASITALKDAQGKGDLLGGITSGLAIAGSVFSAINSITALLSKKEQDRAKEKNEQIEYSSNLQIKAIEAQTKAMERQLALIKDIYGAERIAKYGESIATLNKKITDSKNAVQGKLLLNGNKSDDDIINRTNNTDKKLAQTIRDEALKNGTLKELTVDLSKGADEIERLQALLDSGKFDETTAANVQSLITYVKQYQETLNALKAETTGSTFEEIGNSIVDMFAKGTTSAEDFGKNFEEIMKKSILQTFKGQVLNKALQEYYDQFAEYSKSGNGLDSGEIDALRKQYNDIIANSQTQFDNLQQATGIDFSAGADASTKNTLSGAIKGITADQADLLAGQFGGLRLVQMETNTTVKELISLGQFANEAMTRQLTLLTGIEINTGKTATNTDQLFDIKYDIKTIANKIDSAANALRGAGKI